MGKYEAAVSPLASQLVDIAVGADAETEGLTEQLDSAVLERDAARASLATCQGVIGDLKRRNRRLSRQLTACQATQPDAMFVGSSLHRESGETWQTAFDRRTRNWGVAPESIRLFDEDGRLDAWPAIGGARTYVSFKGAPADVLAGRYDAHYRWLFDQEPAVETWWSYWHEPENDPFTADRYRAAFAHIAGIADQYAAGRALPRGPVIMQWTLDPNNDGPDGDAFIPPTRIDFIGFDCYPSPLVAEIRTKFARCAEFAARHGVAAAMTEVGLENPNSRSADVTARFVTESTAIARELGFTDYLYYDALMSSGHDFRLNTEVEWKAIGAEVSR